MRSIFFVTHLLFLFFFSFFFSLFFLFFFSFFLRGTICTNCFAARVSRIAGRTFLAIFRCCSSDMNGNKQHKAIPVPSKPSAIEMRGYSNICWKLRAMKCQNTRLACFAYCQEFFLSHFYRPSLFNFFPRLPSSFPVKKTVSQTRLGFDELLFALLSL